MSFTPPDLTGMDMRAKARFIQYGNLLYGYNGRNRMRVLDGVGWNLAGIDGGIDGPTFTPITTGSGTGITGTYVYYVAAANYNQLDAFGRCKEALPSSPSAVLVVTNQTITISSIPATHIDPQVTHWNIYRNKDGEYDTGLIPESQDFFLVAAVAIGTTTYDDSTTDDDLTGANLVRFFQNVPPTCTMAEIYGDRIFMCGFAPINDGTATVNADDNTLIDFDSVGYDLPDGVKGCWFQVAGDTAKYRIKALINNAQIQLSDAFAGALASGIYTIYRNPWEIYFSEQINVQAWGPDGEGLRNRLNVPGHETPTALKAFGGMLLVFTAENIYAITGKGPNRSAIKLLPDPVYRGLGAVSQDAVCLVDNECSFLSWRGPATIAGSEPRLFGIVLNTDWLDSLTVPEAALACMGTDDTSIWVSVPVHGQTLNSRTFRYDRQTQSWWEETEMCPTQFIREDADNGRVAQLNYIQDRFVHQSAVGTLDLVFVALNGTLGTNVTRNVTNAVLTGNVATLTAAAHGFVVGQGLVVNISNTNYNGSTFFISAVTANTFSYAITHADIGSAGVTGTTMGFAFDTFNILSNGLLQTSNGGLEQCYVRVYGTRNGVPNQFIGSRRITSNNAHTMSWSSDATLPGGGAMIMQTGDKWEIGNVGWKWLTRTEGNPGHLKNAQNLWVTFGARSLSAFLTKWDVVDGAESARGHNVSAAVLVQKWDANKANFEYAARLGSRTGAVVKNIQIQTIAEDENR